MIWKRKKKNVTYWKESIPVGYKSIILAKGKMASYLSSRVYTLTRVKTKSYVTVCWSKFYDWSIKPNLVVSSKGLQSIHALTNLIEITTQIFAEWINQ